MAIEAGNNSWAERALRLGKEDKELSTALDNLDLIDHSIFTAATYLSASEYPPLIQQIKKMSQAPRTPQVVGTSKVKRLGPNNSDLLAFGKRSYVALLIDGEIMAHIPVLVGNLRDVQMAKKMYKKIWPELFERHYDEMKVILGEEHTAAGEKIFREKFPKLFRVKRFNVFPPGRYAVWMGGDGRTTDYAVYNINEHELMTSL